MSHELQLVIRLVVAGLLGATIGYERELRAKGAGVRTHVLVALGSALFMIISQFGFEGASRFDAARVAAGVVSGIGFLGGGIIIKSGKNHITGLTTAAGLWVTAAMGLGIGCGMFELGVLCTVLVIACLEAMHFYTFKLGGKYITAVFKAKDPAALEAAAKALKAPSEGLHLTKDGDDYRLEVTVSVPKKKSTIDLLNSLLELPGVELESLE